MKGGVDMGRKVRDLTGMRFNELEVVELDHKDNGRAYWRCICSCGEECVVLGNGLTSGHIKSCGHLKKRQVFRELSGLRFGRLTVIEETNDRPHYWLCKCDCGGEKVIYEHNLINGRTLSCGCLHKEKTRESLLEDLTGRRFGRWTVLKIDNSQNDKTRTFWKCQCDCGSIKSIRASALKDGSSTSCGCYKKEFTSELFSHKLEGQRFGKLVVLERAGSFIGTDDTKYSQWLCQCDCGNTKIVRGHDLIRGSVSSCGCMTSKGEYLTRQSLLQYDINFDTQYCFDDLRSDKNWPLRFDFVVFNSDKTINCLIEFQGEQHDPTKEQYHKNFGKQQREVTDIQKREYCLAHNIRLYEIWDIDLIEETIKGIKTNLL